MDGAEGEVESAWEQCAYAVRGSDPERSKGGRVTPSVRDDEAMEVIGA